MSDTVQVSENLKDIAGKLEEAQRQVAEALSIYSSAMFGGSLGTENIDIDWYDGEGKNALLSYCAFLSTRMKELSDLYEKISTYINYVYEEMNEFDNELAQAIESGFDSFKAGGAS